MSFPPGTEMFQFPGFASTAYVFSGRYPKGVGCPIRTSTDQRLLAAPRGFSQRATSFIASWCQGIHRMPFLRSRSTHHAQEPSTPDPYAIHVNKPRHGGPRISTQHTTGSSRPAPVTRQQACRGPAERIQTSLNLTWSRATLPASTQAASTQAGPTGQTSRPGTSNDVPEPDSP
jgi:hypothetical protein